MALPEGLSRIIRALQEDGPLEIEEIGPPGRSFIAEVCQTHGMSFREIDMVIALPTGSLNYDHSVKNRFPNQIKLDGFVTPLILICFNDEEWESRPIKQGGPQR